METQDQQWEYSKATAGRWYQDRAQDWGMFGVREIPMTLLASISNLMGSIWYPYYTPILYTSNYECIYNTIYI
jgi:hypothetical protein